MIRVLLCDDHDYMRRMVREFLKGEADIEVIGEVSDIEALLVTLPTVSPDVLLLDCKLHGHNTVESIGEIVARSPRSQILMFSGEDDPAYSSRALASGARGYLLKDSAEELPGALRQVAGGGSYLDARIRRPAATRRVAGGPALFTPGEPGGIDRQVAHRIAWA